MTASTDIVNYLQDLLRDDPKNTHLKRLIAYERRRKEALGGRSMPRTSTLQAAKMRLFPSNSKIKTSSNTRCGRLPIDDEVCELIEAGHIHVITPQAQAAGREGMTQADALFEARQSVVDGCRWGDYYARLKLGAEQSARATAKIALVDASNLAEAIDSFIQDNAFALSSRRHTSPGLRQSDNTDDFLSEIEALKSAREAASSIAHRLLPYAEDKGGRPGDPWRVGFVFGISQGWMGLTQLRISGSAGALFVNFVAAGGNSLDGVAEHDSDTWSSAIKTAIRDFDLAADRRSWRRRPGPKSPRMKPTP